MAVAEREGGRREGTASIISISWFPASRSFQSAGKVTRRRVTQRLRIVMRSAHHRRYACLGRSYVYVHVNVIPAWNGRAQTRVKRAPLRIADDVAERNSWPPSESWRTRFSFPLSSFLPLCLSLSLPRAASTIAEELFVRLPASEKRRERKKKARTRDSR